MTNTGDLTDEARPDNNEKRQLEKECYDMAFRSGIIDECVLVLY
jgi:hypothetical protein